MTPEKQAADLVGLATGQDRNEAMTHKPMTEDDLEAARNLAEENKARAWGTSSGLDDWALAIFDLLAEIDRLRTPAPVGEAAENIKAFLAEGYKNTLDEDFVRVAGLLDRLSARCAALEGERDRCNVTANRDRIEWQEIVTELTAKLAASEAALAEARQSVTKLEAGKERVKKEVMRIGNMIDHGGLSASWASGELLALFQSMLSPQPKTEGTKSGPTHPRGRHDPARPTIGDRDA